MCMLSKLNDHLIPDLTTPVPPCLDVLVSTNVDMTRDPTTPVPPCLDVLVSTNADMTRDLTTPVLPLSRCLGVNKRGHHK